MDHDVSLDDFLDHYAKNSEALSTYDLSLIASVELSSKDRSRGRPFPKKRSEEKEVA